MPGSIQVSVLGFKELPSSSNSVKLSLGKVEHEVGENETFSFPLTNLRDNLVITVQDSEGNQVSQSGVRTMPVIEKGTWDDVFPIEGGGLIHMKLQFFLSEEERNRIRLMREAAMKKKQAEILGSRHEVSDVLSASSSQDFHKSSSNTDISLKASKSYQGQSFTNVTDKREETYMTQEIEQKPNSSNTLVEKLYEETLKENIPNVVKGTNKENTSNKNNEILLQQAEVPKKLLEDARTRDSLKNNNAVKSEPLDNLVERLDKQILEDKNPNFVKKTSKVSKFPPLSKETEVNTIKNNAIQLQETDLLRRLQNSSSRDVGSSRLSVAEKIKSFSPKLAGEMDNQGSLEKSPQNIKKMISVFESTMSQDRVPLKPASTKSYRFRTSSILKDDTAKDYYERSESSLKNSENSGSSRLRTSFSTGDLRKNLSDIVTKGDQVEYDSNFQEPSENMQSKGNDSKGAEKMGKEALNNEKESIDDRKTSKVNLDYFDQDGSGQCKFLDEKKGEEKESPESTDAEASNGSFGQAMKIALVVGFGVLVFLFRQRDSGKGKKKENTRVLRNQVLMNKRGSIQEQGRRIGVSRLS